MEQKIQESDVLIHHSAKELSAIWERARIIPNFDPAVYRKDLFGAWIKRDEFGNKGVQLSLGWIVINQQTDEPDIDQEQLIPVQWQNAIAHINGYKQGVITASGIINTKVLQT